MYTILNISHFPINHDIIYFKISSFFIIFHYLPCKLMRLGLLNQIVIAKSILESESSIMVRLGFQRLDCNDDHDFDLISIKF